MYAHDLERCVNKIIKSCYDFVTHREEDDDDDGLLGNEIF